MSTTVHIDHDHPSLPGHFPGNPVVPGVVLLERVVAAIEARHGPLPPLRFPQVKFVRPLLPGHTARIELSPTGQDGEPPRWRFRVLEKEQVLATGDIVGG
ncbi:MAG: hypothetical protein Q4F49_08420 [Pseudoxanthomonas suwonensis]|nr:hypothetical protein [Pseudoxanthomonas suwonensis]